MSYFLFDILQQRDFPSRFLVIKNIVFLDFIEPNLSAICKFYCVLVLPNETSKLYEIWISETFQRCTLWYKRKRISSSSSSFSITCFMSSPKQPSLAMNTLRWRCFDRTNKYRSAASKTNLGAQEVFLDLPNLSLSATRIEFRHSKCQMGRERLGPLWASAAPQLRYKAPHLALLYCLLRSASA